MCPRACRACLRERSRRASTSRRCEAPPTFRCSISGIPSQSRAPSPWPFSALPAAWSDAGPWPGWPPGQDWYPSRRVRARPTVSTESPPARRITNRHVMPGVISGLVRNVFRDPRAARDLLFKQVWIDVKRFAAPEILNVRPADIRGLADIVVEGDATRPDSLVLSGLCKLLGCRTVFELGTFH